MSAKETLVFLDIDGTLLRPDYTTNSSLVPALIKKLSKKGFVFALNSNRSIADLTPIVRQFGINGPVIAENGVFMVEGGKRRMFLRAAKILKILTPALKKVARECGAQVSFLDTVREGREKKSAVSEEWLVNKFREYTASIHVRSHGLRDVKAAERLARMLRETLPKSYIVSVSPVFANVLVSPKESDKGKAIAKLKKGPYRGATLLMIGDDAADLPVLKVVDKFYAVGNAHEDIKRRATFVAGKLYTQGVAEILRTIYKCSVADPKIVR